MAKLPRTGSYRTDIALRTVAQCDFEATGQFPARRQNRRRRLPPVFLSSLVAIMSAQPAPAPKPRRRIQRVVEVERSGCSLCQHPLVKGAAVLAMLVFIFSFVAPAWHGQDFVQDHLAGHNGAIYGETEVVFDE